MKIKNISAVWKCGATTSITTAAFEVKMHFNTNIQKVNYIKKGPVVNIRGRHLQIHFPAVFHHYIGDFLHFKPSTVLI